MNKYTQLMRENPAKASIVKRLKQLGKITMEFLEQLGKQRWKDYKKIWHTAEWKEARLLLKDFFTTKEGKCICPICNREIDGSFTLDHKAYPDNTYYIYHPNYCQIICSKHHNKKFHVKMKFFEVFDSTKKKIGELAEFSDGWCVLHYTVNTYPKNEWDKVRSIKIQITKQNWSYKQVIR